QLRDASHVVAEVTVHAPGDGVVIARAVNPGQVVPSGQELFMVTDLKTVWVIGDLYEKDFATVRVGSPATVMVTSASDRQLRGRQAGGARRDRREFLPASGGHADALWGLVRPYAIVASSWLDVRRGGPRR